MHPSTQEMMMSKMIATLLAAGILAALANPALAACGKHGGKARANAAAAVVKKQSVATVSEPKNQSAPPAGAAPEPMATTADGQVMTTIVGSAGQPTTIGG
jgi:hypothetical protein